MKLEKITLWTSTETYGMEDTENHKLTMSALDYVIDAMDKVGECTILSYESEDYKLVPTDES